MSYKVGTVLKSNADGSLVRVTGTSPIKDENDADWVGSSNSLLVTPHDSFGETVPLSIARANKEYTIESEPEEGLEINQSEKASEALTPEEQFAQNAATPAPAAPPAEPPKPPVEAPAVAGDPEDDEDE